MKILDDAVLTELAKLKAVEPITIVGVQWVDKFVPSGAFSPATIEPGPWILYCDRKLEGVHGKLITIGTIDHQLSHTAINSSSVEITLDDSDGLVKGYYDLHDLHKRKCFIWQYFGGLDINTKFLIFQGLTNSPIVWNESARTINFNVLSEIEDKEIGFSADESNYKYVSPSSIGVAWPLGLGECMHVPAVKVRQALTGKLKTKLGITDPTLFYKLQAIVNAYFTEMFMYNYYKGIASRLSTRVETMQDAVSEWVKNVRQQIGTAATTPVQKITEAYCYVIGLEDAIHRKTQKLTDQITVKKQELEQKKKGLIPWGTRTPKQQQADLKKLRDNLKVAKKDLTNITKGKKIIEKAIDEAEYELALQRTAFQKQTVTFNNICELYSQFIDIINEICFQRKSEASIVVIEDGELFPQDVSIDLLIDNMRVRGTFSDNTFNIESILPKYRKVPMGAREDVLNQCGDIENTQQELNSFFIADSKYALHGCWCLIEDITGQRHIIEIDYQDGVYCTFKLVTPPDDNSGGHRRLKRNDIIASSTGFPLFRGANVPGANVVPVYNLPGGRIFPLDIEAGNIFNVGFIKYVNDKLSQYKVDPLDKDEFFNFQRLQQMVMADVAKDYLFFTPVNPAVFYSVVGPNIAKILEVSVVPLSTWLDDSIDAFEIPEKMEWEAKVGTEATDFSSPYDIYVANIIPSSVKAVMAYRTNVLGEKVLESVPEGYYTLNEAENVGDLTVTSLKFWTPLKSIEGELWDDVIYVSYESSVNSNTVVQLKYLIDTYTDKDWDEATFNYVEELFSDKYPSNFAIFDRRNILTILQEIAFQARCLILLYEDIFYLFYLAKEPDSVRTLTNEDIQVDSLTLGYSETEQLVTKLTVTWREDYLPDSKEKQIILRQNIQRYGLHELTYRFYIYNISSLVMKSATFWMIRWSNTWKEVKFKTFLKNMDLQLNDCVQFACTQVASVKGLITHISYDVTSHELTFDCWLPIKAGGSELYPFAWPADATVAFPLATDEVGGNQFKLLEVKGDKNAK